MISLGGVTDGGTEKEGETGAKEKGEQSIMWDSGITRLRTERFDRGVVLIGRSGHIGLGGWSKTPIVR